MNQTEKNTVLIVDDEPMNIMTLSNYLSPEYTIYATKNPKDAVREATKRQPDLILLDIIMPEMDGYEVLSALKSSEHTSSIPVIIISSLNDHTDEEKGLAMGASDYIIKPFKSTLVKLRVGNQMKLLKQIRTLQQYMASLEAVSNAKSYFLANMGHDFKTPLTIISLSIQDVLDMLQFKLNKNEVRESLQTAQSEVMRMSRIVDSAMKHSFLQNNKNDMDVLNITQFLREGAETYRILLERNNNTLTFDIGEAPVFVFGNADMLLLVLSNLISNANRHTRDGNIHIKTELISHPNGNDLAPQNDSSPQHVQVSVRDTGAGIHPDILPHIFERGVSQGSTGLGLSICKSTIERHDGVINVKSKQGKGTSIIFTLPLHKKSQGGV